MTLASIHQFKHWLKFHPNSRIRNVFFILKNIRSAELPTPKVFNRALYQVHKLIVNIIGGVTRFCYWTPAFKGRVAQCGKRLYLYGGLPFVSGPLQISIGDDCRVSGHTTFSGCTQPLEGLEHPLLSIGNNVDIGWQSTIAVGKRVIISDNVRIAGGAFLFGYSGHPLDAKRRAQGEGDDPQQIGDIILEQDVWLGTNVTVKGGVTIGEGAVIAAGSVVTKSIPAFAIAAGNPARVVGQIKSVEVTESDVFDSLETHGGDHA
ncbi:succinyltransferase-like protein [Vibrio crassostreae]|uniref:acyltransferase n=1 Tax=Vibrio crassostreae TaxID=246167 RepID=UPI000F467621|nr:acyltransferase [Vibrio crassostreae]ROO75651.1 succinyltransferase-like protein [Vibrio crassostreae]ROP13658.1 succinyltransferase-like protein [Vibrio crassostreae]ROQ87746.1 succinyltransferase-like protein [Vibrio crassostreae]ROR87896.1 succinyltransferase-like protein [Vibrio crassostreae]RPE95103.1 succinyltransferase-like protein [Vibrio crassostreae]